MAAADSPAFGTPAPELRAAGKTTLTLLAILSPMALAGGAALVARPDGSVMSMSVDLLAGSPFADYLVPGLILGGLFGVGSLVVLALGLLRWRIAPFLAFAVGVAQMIWIVVELAVIRTVSILHPICFAIGLAIAVAAVPWGRPVLRSWRARGA
jgi:hypothetical protein